MQPIYCLTKFIIMKTKTFRTVLCGMTLLTASACVEEHLEQDVLYDAEVKATIQAPASAVSFLGDSSPKNETAEAGA